MWQLHLLNFPNQLAQLWWIMSNHFALISLTAIAFHSDDRILIKWESDSPHTIIPSIAGRCPYRHFHQSMGINHHPWSSMSMREQLISDATVIRQPFLLASSLRYIFLHLWLFLWDKKNLLLRIILCRSPVSLIGSDIYPKSKWSGVVSYFSFLSLC